MQDEATVWKSLVKSNVTKVGNDELLGVEMDGCLDKNAMIKLSSYVNEWFSKNGL